MTEQISMNNKMLKTMIENSDFGNDNKEKEEPLKDFLDIKGLMLYFLIQEE